MIYKKKDHNCYSNYRAICLLCHAYKLLSAVISARLHQDLEHVLPDSQAGFRRARGNRDNICILKWSIEMILREGREAIITFIDYTAAFDTESKKFFDEALAAANVSTKLRRVIQAILACYSELLTVAFGYARMTVHLRIQTSSKSRAVVFKVISSRRLHLSLAFGASSPNMTSLELALLSDSCHTQFIS